MGKVAVEEDGPKGDVAEQEHRVRRVDVQLNGHIRDEPPPQPPEYPSGFYFTTKR